MGLDIWAYWQIRKLDAIVDEDGWATDPKTGEDVDGSVLYVNPHFPDRANNVEHKGVYAFTEAKHFRIGSYSYHYRWRDWLAELAGWPQTQRTEYGRLVPSFQASTWEATGGPFWELINFSDCEGTLGAEVCAKLAKDFAEFQSKADAHEDTDFRATYAMWREACEIAADGGAIDFL